MPLGGQAYYLESVAAGREDLRPPGGEPDGTWLGSAAHALGLEGRVGAAALEELLAGRRPGTREALNPAQGRIRVAGLDLTFSAPKSVSLLYGLGAGAVPGEVRACHEAAVADVVDHLEREAASARRQGGGEDRSVAVRGLAAASFTHRTSRLGDPHLHSHVLVANLVQGRDDGRWSALDASRLYAHARVAGDLYQARLRLELGRRLGVEWGPLAAGVAQVAGMDTGVLEAFSRRRSQVEERLASWGAAGPGASRAAALATRPAKDATRSVESLRAEWAERAAALGLGREEVGRLARPGGGSRPGRAPALEEVAPALLGPGGLAAVTGSFGRREVLGALARSARAGATVADVERLAGQLLRSGLVEERRAGGRRRDGPRWTTAALARAEAGMGREAARRRDAGAGLAREGAVAGALARRPWLSASQAAALRRLTGSGAGVEVLEAPGGPVGTDVLEAAREAWESAGLRVLGVAPAPSSAARLEAGTGIAAVGPERLAVAAGPGDGRGAVVVVAEAESLGVGRLAGFLAGLPAAKVVLVAGGLRDGPGVGAIAAVAAELGPVMVRDGAEQAPGRTEVVDCEGRSVVVGETAGGLRAALVGRWWEERLAGRRAVLVAPGRQEARALNEEVRRRMTRAGLLGEVVLPAARGRPELAAGDRVVVRWTPARSVLGPGAEVEVLRLEGSRLVVGADGGREAALSLGALRPGQLGYAYAMGPADVARGRAGAPAMVLGGPEALAAGRGPGRGDCFGVLSGTPARLCEVAALRDPLLALAPALPTLGPAAAHPASRLDRVGPELARLRARLVATLPPDVAPAMAALAEEREAVEAGLRRAREAGRPELARRWQEAGTGLAARVAELEVAARRRGEWATEHAPELARYAGLVEAEGRRRLALGRAAEVLAPDRVEAALGPRPLDPEGRARWREAAGALEAHRERWAGEVGCSARRERERAEMERVVAAACRGLRRVAGREHDTGRRLGLAR